VEEDHDSGSGLQCEKERHEKFFFSGELMAGMSDEVRHSPFVNLGENDPKASVLVFTP
jgi:hypothetical protein